MMTNKILADKLLTYTFVVFLFCIGADKIFQANLITNWQSLIGPVISFLMPMKAGSIVMFEGFIEILLGISLLTPWKKVGLTVLAITIALVAIDLFILGYINLAIREIILILVCAAMYLLEESTPELLIERHRH
jgi:uncharacterized membrane protein